MYYLVFYKEISGSREECNCYYTWLVKATTKTKAKQVFKNWYNSKFPCKTSIKNIEEIYEFEKIELIE